LFLLAEEVDKRNSVKPVQLAKPPKTERETKEKEKHRPKTARNSSAKAARGKKKGNKGGRLDRKFIVIVI